MIGTLHIPQELLDDGFEPAIATRVGTAQMYSHRLAPGDFGRVYAALEQPGGLEGG